jgi:hypothetical protein
VQVLFCLISVDNSTSKQDVELSREFNPSFAAVSKAWTKVPAAERDSFIFGTLDFDSAPTVFQKVSKTFVSSLSLYRHR